MRTWRAEDAYYNLLVRGFRAGQLDLKTEVPAGLAHLADPYDPIANADYLQVDGHPLWDLSYYHGKLYLYYGVTPALVLFWPYAALTGHYLGHKDAVVVFCAMGFLASVGLLCLVWRRYFPEIGLAVVAAGTLALGLAGFTPIILPRAECLRGGDQLRLCADDAGLAGAVGGLPPAPSARAMVGRGQSGLRIGRRGATERAVWGRDPVGAGGSGLA